MTWEVELIGGPCDGQVMRAPGSDFNGLPFDRIYAVAYEPPTVMMTRADVMEPCPMKRLVYERGEAINDVTHRWPYRFTGVTY